MKYRTLGRTGLNVSEVGFGAWGIGKAAWIGADDAVSLQALKAARDSGINFFDTALVYGRGESERLIARAFGRSDEIVTATKVPPQNGAWPARAGTRLKQAFPRRHVLECLTTSLRNLQRESVDIFQFHVWSDEWGRDPEWHRLVDEIRGAGKARFIGISVNDHQPENVLETLQSGLIDTVQVIYNLFDQSPEERLFPYCAERNIGVIARVPFDEGSLTGSIRPDSVFPEGDFRNRYFAGERKQQVWNRVQRLSADAGIELDQLPNLALRFCLSHPAVKTVIPGMRSPDHVWANSSASDEGPLSPDLLRKLKEHRWSRNFYDPPVSQRNGRGSIARLSSRIRSLLGK
jgi:aryl-alcohol dehydrogenase-like predicted oxidoreductase